MPAHACARLLRQRDGDPFPLAESYLAWVSSGTAELPPPAVLAWQSRFSDSLFILAIFGMWLPVSLQNAGCAHARH